MIRERGAEGRSDMTDSWCFSKAYGSFASEVARAAAAYVAEVKSGAFPTEVHSYGQAGAWS
jgi:ketopantoate hydroxymethyltransferase